MYNSYFPNYMTSPVKQEVIQVDGKPGVDAFQMAPNSSVLLLDRTAPIVWLAQTDGAGYKTSTPFKIEPFEPEKPTDINALEERIAKLEAMINESDTPKTRKSKSKSNDADGESA